MQWQDIETAPKDGTWFLAYGERDEGDDLPPIGPCRWRANSFDRWEQVSPTRKELVTHFESDWDWDSGLYNLSHWMPLPEPPTA
jgi:hypothetical protein